MEFHQQAPVSASKVRIDYVDFLKGIAIFLVVWLHSGQNFDWNSPNLVNSLFFFLSGFFFKSASFSKLTKAKFKQLMIPCIIFFIAAYPFTLGLHYWDNRSFDTYDFGNLRSFFTISERSDYLFGNVPLWFLMCLYVTMIIFNCIVGLKKWALFLICVSILFMENNFAPFASPFMINNACFWVSYFGLGYILGQPILKANTKPQNRLYIFTIGLAGFAGCYLLSEANVVPDMIIHLAYHLKLLFLYIALLGIVPFVDGSGWLYPIRWMGTNSLALLCVHDPIVTVMHRISRKYCGNAPWLGLADTIITIIICIPIVCALKKYVPAAIGISSKKK